MWVVGIDENGLGPLLGPLVVTAVVFETPSYDRPSFWRAVDDIVPADDSKKIFKKSSLKTAERATLSWLHAFGIGAGSHRELEERLCLPPPFAAPVDQAVCSGCDPRGESLPVWADPEDGDAVARVRRSYERLQVRPAAMRAFSLCPGMFNLATSDSQMNKFRLDFSLMIELVKAIAKQCDAKGDLLALCGKVGSTRYYGPWLDAMGVGSWSAVEEGREVSSYRVPSLGQLSFIKDGDALHLPVAVASMVGKYLRELAMLQLNRRLAGPGVRPASGYRDKVTKAFVSQTVARRAALRIEDVCFLRNS